MSLPALAVFAVVGFILLVVTLGYFLTLAISRFLDWLVD